MQLFPLLLFLMFWQLVTCENKQPASRSNVPNLENKAVELGDLYDGLTDRLLTPKNFYKPETIENNKKKYPATSQKTEFSASEDYLDRVDLIDLSAELALSFYGGLIEIKGSAEYLHNEDLTENDVQTTLTYSGTTFSERLPYGLALDNNDLCNLVDADGPEKPTHVVSEVTYGLRAYMQFSKRFRSQKERRKIAGSLEVLVRAVPSFSIEGKASINLTETQEKIRKDLKLDYYGDALIDSPTTFEEAVRVYKSLTNLTNNSQKVVQFALAPIQDYCRVTNNILNDISNQNVLLVSKMRADFTKVEKRLRTLMGSLVAKGYPRYKNILAAFRASYGKFKTEKIVEMQEILPTIRGGGESEHRLTKLIGSYEVSIYNWVHVESFLDVRNREIGTITNVLEQADKSTTNSIEVDYGGSSEGNICILDHADIRSIIYTLRVLPTDNVAEQFASSTPGLWNERNKWFFNTAEVQRTGKVLQEFMQFHKANAALKESCFLIRLESEDQTKAAAQIEILENGNTMTENFHPPKKISTLKILNEVRGWKDYSFIVNWEEPNVFIKCIKLKLWEVSNGEGQDDAQILSYCDNHMSTSVTKFIDIKNLRPNFQYGVSLLFTTEFGIGEESDEMIIQTLANDTPSQVQVKSITPNSVKMAWNKPTFVAPGVSIDIYEYKITKGILFNKCQAITVNLNNGALVQRALKGTYEISEIVNEKPSWASSTHAIWYIPDFNQWAIGNLDWIGNKSRSAFTNLEEYQLPDYYSNAWKYWNGNGFVPTNPNDIKVKCADNEGDVQDVQANQIPVVTQQTFPMEFEIDVLQPAEHYLFHIRAKSSNLSLTMSTSRNGGVIGTSKNEWFTLPFSTSPAKLEAPTMESKNEDSITVNWEPYQKIAEGAEFLYYQIKATRKNNRGDIKTITSRTNHGTISDLQAGEKYYIQVMTKTNKGNSPFSSMLSVTTDPTNLTQTQRMKKSLGINDLDAGINALNAKNTKVLTSINDLNAKNTKVLTSINDLNAKVVTSINDVLSKVIAATLPLGSIIPWVNRPNQYSRRVKSDVPTGWQRCDGSVINGPSQWKGERTPNLNGEERFLRGGPDSKMMQAQGHSLQAHTHGAYDTGHTHKYTKTYARIGLSRQHGSTVLQDFINNNGLKNANYKVVLDNSEGYFRSEFLGPLGKSNIKVTGVSGATTSSETRPKNMFVVYIMKVF